MKEIKIVERKVLNNDYIVFPTSYINPMADLHFLNHELRIRIGIPCNILVDLLLCNGKNFNRFIRFSFDGCSIDKSSIEIVRLNSAEESDVNEFYRNNIDFIKNGVLVPHEYLEYVQ